MAQKKSKRWSIADIRTIKKFVLDAKNAGMDGHDGLKEAAKHFGITLNAVRIRYGRFIKGKQVANLKKNTTKEPMERKTRKYTKRTSAKPRPNPELVKTLANHLIKESNKLVFPLGLLAAHVPKITAITVDFDTRSITYTY